MKKLLIALMAISLIFGLASCKSTNQEDASETPVEQPQEPTDETVDDTTDESTDETDSFAEKNAKLMEKLSGSRDGAIKAGADKYYADQLSALDEQLKALKEKAADSNEDLSEEIEDLNYRYLALQKASETKQLKEKIEEHGFDQDNKIAYDAAEALLAELEKVINENASGKVQYKAAEATYAAYHTIFYSSFKKLADAERKSALEQKKAADNVKAGVAQKDKYKAITEVFQKGDNAYVTKNPETAYDCYKEAKEKYEALAIEIAEKRAAAQKRIDEAKAKVQDVENFAGEADVKAPIGDEKIDGIEEKDAVLLEEDKFENPDDAVIEVEDSVKVENDGVVEVFKDAFKAEGDR